MKTVFTQQQVKGLKAKATEKRQEFRDHGGQNLYIVVQPKSGETSFVIRPTVNGKQRRITIGHFPDMSLADAREEAARYKAAVRQGKPLERSQSPSQEMGVTVREAWDLYWQHEASSRKSADEKQRIFDKDVAPIIGSKALNDVTRDDLAILISGKFATAKTASNRLHSLLARFFRWCLTQGHSLTKLDSNPMASIVKMHSERGSARRRYLDKDELTWWFQALPAAGDRFQTRWSSDAVKDYREQTGRNLGNDFPIKKVREEALKRLPILKGWHSCGLRWCDLQYIESCAIVDAVHQLAIVHGVTRPR